MDKAKRLEKIIATINKYKHKQPKFSVKIVEVGPRDGLQNEKKIISLADK